MYSRAGPAWARQELPAFADEAVFYLGGGKVLVVEEAFVAAGLHQFYEAQDDGAGFDEGECVGEGGFGVFAQQQGVGFDGGEALFQHGVYIALDVEAFVFAGDFAEGFGIEAVYADVDFVQPCGAVGGEEPAEAVGVGGEGDAFYFRLGAAGGDDVGQVAPEGGFAARNADFACAALGEGFCQYGDFGNGKLVGIGFALIAFGQAVAAFVVAQVGYGEAQVGQPAVEGVGERGDVHGLVWFCVFSGCLIGFAVWAA